MNADIRDAGERVVRVFTPGRENFAAGVWSVRRGLISPIAAERRNPATFTTAIDHHHYDTKA